MILLPDDAIEPTVTMSEKIWVRHERGGLVLLAVAVEPSQVSILMPFAASSPARAGCGNLPAPSICSLLSATPSVSWFMMASAMILATQSASLRKRGIRPPPPEVRTGIVP